MVGPVSAALLLALLERVPRFRFRRAPLFRPHLATDVIYLLTGFVAAGAAGAAYLAAGRDFVEARMDLGQILWPAVPFGLQVVAALGAIDLGNYAAHWLLHRSDRLWEFHKAHHSSLHLDWMATFRSHIVEQLLRRLLAPLLLIVAGVPAAAVAVAAAIFFAWAMLNHANLQLPLGFLEGVFVTPRLHRVHHVPATTERNLGTVFTCWDRLLGRFVAEGPVPTATFGLPRERETYPQDWWRQLLTPWSRPSSAGAARRTSAAASARMRAPFAASS